jgi:hypothetical protein
MLYKAKAGDQLLMRSMGKTFRITAIATSDEEANAHMARHDEEACIACFGPFVLMANKYDPGKR